jgi:ubiquinol-cytochrome c reductase iron-sulfur subunit
MSTLLRTGPTVSRAVVSSSPSSYNPSKESHEPKLPMAAAARLTTQSLNRESWKAGLFSPGMRVNRNITSGQPSQYRLYHTDVQFPDMDHYRRDVSKDITVPSKDTHDQRRFTTYTMHAGMGMVGLYMSKSIVTTLVGYKSMTKDMLAMASTEIMKADIPPATTKTFKWRGKPVFVRHRTDAEIEKENAVALSSLRDPQTDAERVQDPKWAVTIGICTHLGCVPQPDKGAYGGFYCACHGSHYDTVGRVRRGPAPLNLEVPAYTLSDEMIVVG